MSKLANPAGLHGEAASFWSVDVPLVCADTILVGDAVAWTAPGTVEKFDVSDALPELFAGVAVEGGTAGKVIVVTVFGHARVNVGASAPALGTLAGIGAADGLLASVAAIDATAVAGDNVGVFQGAKDANNRAPVWLSRF